MHAQHPNICSGHCTHSSKYLNRTGQTEYYHTRFTARLNGQRMVTGQYRPLKLKTSFIIISRRKQTWICITHHREHASNAQPLPVRRRWSPIASSQPDTSQTLQDHGYGLVHHAIAQAKYTWMPGSAPRWLTRPIRRSPMHALTGSGAE